MPQMETRILLAVVVAIGLGIVLAVLPPRRWLPFDLVVVVYAVVVALLGVFAFLGVQAAVVAGAVIVAAVLLGGAIYALLAVAGRWAQKG